MAKLTAEEETLKRAIYDKLAPRRRKFIDKLGYETWDPFQKPLDPIDIRKDENQMTAQDLVRAFLKTVPEKEGSESFALGAFEICNGVINRSERHMGMYQFVRWYVEIMQEHTDLMKLKV